MTRVALYARERILAEALDRVSRDQADTAMLYKHLQFAGMTEGQA